MALTHGPRASPHISSRQEEIEMAQYPVRFVMRFGEDYSFVVPSAAAELAGLRKNELCEFTATRGTRSVSWLGRVRKNGLSGSLRARPGAHARHFLGLRPGMVLQAT